MRDEFNPFLNGKRLFQQWIVDFMVKIEKDRLQFFEKNQILFRIDSYNGVFDYLQKRVTGNSGTRIGKVKILPATFRNSFRNTLEHYHDAMALARKYGIADLFITITCNPNWQEIKENLSSDQTHSDRPDLLVKVF